MVDGLAPVSARVGGRLDAWKATKDFTFSLPPGLKPGTRRHRRAAIEALLLSLCCKVQTYLPVLAVDGIITKSWVGSFYTYTLYINYCSSECHAEQFRVFFLQ
jgi:hypothetical protein